MIPRPAPPDLGASRPRPQVGFVLRRRLRSREDVDPQKRSTNSPDDRQPRASDQQHPTRGPRPHPHHERVPRPTGLVHLPAALQRAPAPPSPESTTTRRSPQPPVALRERWSPVGVSSIGREVGGMVSRVFGPRSQRLASLLRLRFAQVIRQSGDPGRVCEVDVGGWIARQEVRARPNPVELASKATASGPGSRSSRPTTAAVSGTRCSAKISPVRPSRGPGHGRSGVNVQPDRSARDCGTTAHGPPWRQPAATCVRGPGLSFPVPAAFSLGRPGSCRSLPVQTGGVKAREATAQRPGPDTTRETGNLPGRAGPAPQVPHFIRPKMTLARHPSRGQARFKGGDWRAKTGTTGVLPLGTSCAVPNRRATTPRPRMRRRSLPAERPWQRFTGCLGTGPRQRRRLGSLSTSLRRRRSPTHRQPAHR